MLERNYNSSEQFDCNWIHKLLEWLGCGVSGPNKIKAQTIAKIQ